MSVGSDMYRKPVIDSQQETRDVLKYPQSLSLPLCIALYVYQYVYLQSSEGKARQY